MPEFKGGYAGHVVEFDLASEKEKVRSINEDEDLNRILELFLGGRGLGVKLLYDNTKKGVSPLSRENLMVFSTGPLTGIPSPTPGRMTVTTKSPLTGTISTSNSGSKQLARSIKQLGLDAFILKDRAKKYSYLRITEDGFSLEGAEELKGSDTKETTNELRERHGEKTGTVVIGPAAENEVPLANMHVDNMNFFGRGGQGRVLYSKNLKGIVVEGQGAVPKPANPEEFSYEKGSAIYEAERRGIANNRVTKAHSRLGTPTILGPLNEGFGAFPTRNFKDSHFEGGKNLEGEVLEKEVKVEDDGCFGCSIRCKKRTRSGEKEGHGPEYETLYALGSSLGLEDMKKVTRLNYLCNELGIDTISTGLTIACAMDMFEDGVITKEDADGMELGFGADEETLEKLVRKISAREGFGSLLADGSHHLAEHFDRPEYSMSVNGLELAGYDPRVLKGMSLVFAQSNRGACHLRGGLTTSYEFYGTPKIVDPLTIAGKGNLAARCQDTNAYIDSLIGCLLASPAISSDVWAKLTTASVFEKGGDHSYTPEDLMGVGERIYNLERWFNHREGISPSNYKLPDRLLTEEVKSGPRKGERLTKENYLSMEREYYEARGWENGIPTEEKLEELKILE